MSKKNRGNHLMKKRHYLGAFLENNSEEPVDIKVKNCKIKTCTFCVL